MKRYWREIAYYVCVMLVLGVIAWGAENYRMRRVRTVDIPMSVSAETVEAQMEPCFSLTEGMEVCGEFSAQPVWNEFHGCWQAHPAVDFACTEGDVYAICGGKVKTMGKSGVYGGFIEIEDEEILLRYCSMEVNEDLQVGTEVKMGELIGIADESMPGEAHMGAHVHVEVICEGKMQDVTLLTETSD